MADIVFAIATKRDELARVLRWRTTEWLQAETAIGYTLNKLVIVFVDNDVDLSGLAEKFIYIKFDSTSIYGFSEFLDEIMPQIRDIIRKNRIQDNLKKLFKGISIVGGLYIISIASYQAGKEDQS
ncbi:hypothetical protein [Candidatus Harpocratesius sp.]